MRGDARDQALLERVLGEYEVETVIRFWRRTTGAYMIVRDYGPRAPPSPGPPAPPTSAPTRWRSGSATPTPPPRWRLAATPFTVTAGAGPIQVTAVMANRTSPQPVGTAITWTALATGGTPPLAYQFFVRRVEDGGGFQVVQPWGPSAAVTYAPTRAGTYVVAVWVRSAGGSAPEAGAVAAPFAIVP